MAISILYLNERKNYVKPISDRILYHLSLDRSFSHICADIKKREYFLSVVSDLTNDQNEILYRQAIIKDFENNPTLLEQLISLSTRFEELRITQKTAGRDEYRLNATGTASSATAKNILQAQALCLKRALLFIKAYGELLEKYELKSDGLKSLYSSCKEMYECPDYAKLITFCSKYENFSASRYWDFKFALNDEGRIEAYELIDHRYIHVTDPELKKKGFSLFKKAEEVTYPCQRLAPAKDGLYERLAVFALSDLSGAFAKISEQIFEKYGLIGRELIFYDVSLKYIQALSGKEVPVRYPIFTEDQSIKVRNLYDLYLLMSKPNTSSVIPNDFMLGKANGGLLVFGNNGSGKTVYLRSIGTMQILAQAGLPIPCESAEITLFSQLATQFSEAEKEFCEGNDAGRFEQEVRELAAMVDTLKEGSLVFLNETFQSTAYAEGAEGLYHLLKHFSAFNIRWILVSHLRQLEEMFENNEVTILHTAEGYKIV
ncbi:MAG: hypothetical protein IKB28_01250 [Clostridia bacterium]|nr:hypothetical protein [Clostridia bacterium]